MSRKARIISIIIAAGCFILAGHLEYNWQLQEQAAIEAQR